MLYFDKAIIVTIVNRAWSFLAAPISLLFIGNYFSPIEQGFYYGFASMLGLQVFFELGLGYVIMQTASHLSGGEDKNSSGLNDGLKSKALLGRLFADVVKIYCAIFLIFTIFMGAGGWWFFERSADSSVVDWQLPWILLVPIFGFSILTNAVFSFLEGMGLVADIAIARLLQLIAGTIILWMALIVGWKLGGLVLYNAASLAVAIAIILVRHQKALWALYLVRGLPGSIQWKKEIWPFQWRIALSWISGYLGTQSITLIIFDRLGPVDAGKFGFSLTAMGAIVSGASVWFSTKAPIYGKYIVQGKLGELDSIYYKTLKTAIIVGIMGVTIFMTALIIMNLFKYQIVDRFLPLTALLVMGFAAVAQVRIGAQATYLRAYRKEPFLLFSLAIGLIQAISAYILTSYFNLEYTIIFYSFMYSMVGVFWANHIFKNNKLKYVKR